MRQIPDMLIMRQIIVLITLLLVSVSLQAGELEQAYQKEYAYLVAEKKALSQQLANLKLSQKKNLTKVVAEIEDRQQIFLSRQNQTDQLNRRLVEASRNVDFSENDSLLLDTTLIQAKESLSKMKINIDDTAPVGIRLVNAFSRANEIMQNDARVNETEGRFFLPDGKAINGKVINIGRIASFGIGENAGGALAPAGNGDFRVWDGESRHTAEQLADNLYPETLNVFLFDSIDKGIEKRDEKTLSDDIKASGMVGKIIIALGVIGMLLVGFRIFVLTLAGSDVQTVSAKVNKEIENGDTDKALQICKENVCAASKVIAATLRNLKRDRDHLEDIISETILNESSNIDKFGSAILVIAAISPLLGLLGTVTGMISTFDIITEFGTGDPKLLSSGISEALLTTMFGLVVAIPLLLAGNLLSSWGRQIKNNLEQAALHMINKHKV